MRRRAVAAVALLAGASLAAAAWRERARARHLAVPVLSDPSSAPDPGVPLAEGPPCAAEEVARAGARVTAVLEARDGELWIGTFDGGVLRAGAPGFPPEAVAGLEGRQLLVNALLEHDGLVWVATQGGLVAFDGERRVLALLAGEPVTALLALRGALYAGTGRGLLRIGVHEGAERVDLAGPAGEPIRPTALAASGDRLWIGTGSGVYALPLASLDAPLLARTARWHPLVFGEPPAETNVVTALAPLAGGVVAGTDDGGLALVRADGRVSASRFAEARANEVNPGAAAVGPDGAVLAGTQGGGVLVARPGPGGLEVVRAGGVGRREISAVAPAARGALVGTADGAVLRIACGAAPAS
ncbi:MAG TPA: two-component regulator propeller domain-containing protein [Anaeromyxobacter sp.]|nr:two-component regulator propeller domain-containing protein [Anaeromyxobacter sp.]